MPKKLKYQYSVSVSFLEKSVKKRAKEENVKNLDELKFLFNRHQPQNMSDLMSFIMRNRVYSSDEANIGVFIVTSS